MHQPPAPNQPPPRVRGGSRFRWGIALSGGGAFVSGWKLGMAGLDARLGMQINDLIGVYLQPHLSLGGGSRAGLVGLTGFAGVAAMVDVTLLDRFFAGAGGGVTVLNNPLAGELHFRGGIYPMMSRNYGGKRSGLMIGVDVRTYFLSGLSVLHVMGSIGYESF